jgi:hypothetical protein
MKMPYFKLKDAFNEVRENFSYGTGGEKVSAAAKLLGKSVANVGMLAAEIGVEVVKNAPKTAGKMAEKNLNENRHKMSDEQIERAERVVEAAKRHEEKERAKKLSERENGE